MKKQIRINGKRRDEIDLDRLVHALLALAEDLAEDRTKQTDDEDLKPNPKGPA